LSEALDVKAVDSEASVAKPQPRVVNLERVLAVDPSKFSEVERIVHVSSVRDALDAIANTKQPSAELLAKKIKLLRLWCELVKLRVDSVRANAPPPEHQPLLNRRGKSSVKLKVAGKRTLGKKPLDVASVETAAINEPGRIQLRLLEAGMVGGVMLPAGATIDVEPHDAEELLASKMAIRTTQEKSD
jgi:hypothetical protein